MVQKNQFLLIKLLIEYLFFLQAYLLIPIVVAQKAIPGLYNDITSTEIDNYLAETAAALTVEHPDYSYLAARIKSNALHKETPGFIIATKIYLMMVLLKEDYYKKVIENSDAIESIIDYDRDYSFDYFALTTLIRAYLLKFENKLLKGLKIYGCV